METLLLSLKDVRQALSMKEVISAIEEGYIAYYREKVQQPDIVSIEIPRNNGETDIKSCYNELNEIISVKVASGFYNNGKINHLPSMIGTILLYGGRTGAPLCIMDGSLITGIRTGAAGAISSKLLARKDSKTVAVFGAGGQARMQIYALCEVMNIEEVRVYSNNKEELPKYKQDIEENTKVKVILCDTVEKAMEGADIAISTTPSKKYYIDKSCVRTGMHIVAVGADMPGKNEWEPEVFRGAKIVNDSIAQCISRGETRNAIIAGVIKESDIYGEIGQLLAGEKPLRENDDEITIFDTTGMGIQDNVTAVMVYELAKRKGLGEYFEFI
ncbi:ornithine cyclodeaminase family protein [Lutispora thermophila]|uniref:Ornithine cyclodeaminase n=1 Tax=Lutispora thermophila DSM 19022 TaxID=1122184 RepID=A0A1M6HE54_9FIRM|nr:ornithine cyclodeaminase family protein [Lutispora thermophila]SHJ20462.1 ornithine cyclodeaminase [Lutispora thermophila DSM 19022]